MTTDWTSIIAIITVATTAISTIYTGHKNNKSNCYLKEMEISSTLKLKALEIKILKYEELSKEYCKNSKIRERLLCLNAKIENLEYLENNSLNNSEAEEFVMLSVKLSENTYKLSIFLNEEEYKNYQKSREVLENQDIPNTKKILNISYLISNLIEDKLREFNSNEN